MNKNIIISLIISFTLILSMIFFIGNKSNNSSNLPSIPNVSVIDGVQYVTINVRGGYSPKVSTIKGGIPTKLIMKTNNAYDCSTALSIPSLGVRKMLQPTGEEVVDLGSLESGKTINGTCSMGMYSFKVVAE